MAKTTYLVTIDDNPIDNYGQEKRVKVTLHEAHSYLVPGAVGKYITASLVPDSKHIALGAKVVFAAVFGNPPEKPPLRNLTAQLGNRMMRDGIDNRGGA